MDINNKKVYIFRNKKRKTRSSKKTKNNTIATTIILTLSISANNSKPKLIFLKRLTYKKR